MILPDWFQSSGSTICTQFCCEEALNGVVVILILLQSYVLWFGFAIFRSFAAFVAFLTRLSISLLLQGMWLLTSGYALPGFTYLFVYSSFLSRSSFLGLYLKKNTSFVSYEVIDRFVFLRNRTCFRQDFQILVKD